MPHFIPRLCSLSTILIETSWSHLQQENKDATDRKLELSNMNKWKSEKEAAESQMNHLKSENQRLASLEARYNLLLKSELY